MKPDSTDQNDISFPVVGIGASAGGLDAIRGILEHLPQKPGMAIVVVQHLDPNGKSALKEILSRATPVTVMDAEDDLPVEVDHVYTVRPGLEVHLEDGRFRIEPLAHTHLPMPIDTFLESLARDRKERSIAVILSGGGTDGTLGAEAIKQEGGIVIAQDDTAEHRHMPHSAVASGVVDKVLAPSEIAVELARLAREPYLKSSIRPASETLDSQDLSSIFRILDKREGIDFSSYKRATVARRIQRRMTLHRITELPKYVEYLESHPHEAGELAQDMLIRVTGFFRDPAVFEFLRTKALPEVLEAHPAGETFRVWVPGCATGEEVYSLAILLDELTAGDDRDLSFQIFGTDISERAIAQARNGVYRENVIRELSQARLERYFTRLDDHYQIRRSLRDLCVFARQDLTRDPPFSKLDLVSCRNVLIYLDASLQRRVFRILQYALRQGGILMLGTSETTSLASEVFEPLHRKFRIYRKRSDAGRLPAEIGRWQVDSLSSHPGRSRPPEGQRNLLQEADHVVLHQVAPPGVLITENFDVVQFRGRTSRFLEPPPGAPTFNLMKMARQGLIAELRSGVNEAKRSGSAVSRPKVTVRLEGEEIIIDLDIIPVRSPDSELHFLILFKERQGESIEQSDETPDRPRLKRELEATREYLQSIIEEQEVMNEDLRGANEEIQSSNEELQSTNEELETAKEELQSTNEELTTLNEELTVRNQELDHLNNDLVNILTSVEIPIVLLTGSMTIRRFNPSAQRALGLIPEDEGRPIADMRASLEIGPLEQTAREVMETLSVREIDLTTSVGRSYHLQIRPYKTTDNRIDGVVLVFLEERPEEE